LHEKFHRATSAPPRPFYSLLMTVSLLKTTILHWSPTRPAWYRDPLQAQISLHTLSGYSAPETLRLVGHIALQPVVILVDVGSTHNFIQEHLVPQLGLSPCPTAPLRVMMGNGHQLDSHLLCKATPIQVQDITFVVDLHVLPLCGANLVLGVQWLKSLGPVLTDYNTLSLKFIRDGCIIEFQGETNSSLHLITPPQLRRLFRKEGANAYFHIHNTSSNLPSTQTNIDHLPSTIQNLIAKFAPLF